MPLGNIQIIFLRKFVYIYLFGMMEKSNIPFSNNAFGNFKTTAMQTPASLGIAMRNKNISPCYD